MLIYTHLLKRRSLDKFYLNIAEEKILPCLSLKLFICPKFSLGCYIIFSKNSILKSYFSTSQNTVMKNSKKFTLALEDICFLKENIDEFETLVAKQ